MCKSDQKRLKEIENFIKAEMEKKFELMRFMCCLENLLVRQFKEIRAEQTDKIKEVRDLNCKINTNLDEICRMLGCSTTEWKNADDAVKKQWSILESLIKSE